MNDVLRVGLLAPHTGAAAGPESLREVAAAAEELGFDSLWCGDHVVLPAHQESSYPYGSQDADDSYEVPSDRPFLEPMSTLGFLAAVTTRLTIGLSVAILPYRSPALWAKTVGTVDLLARGRFVLGAGVGWLAEEFAVLGSDFSTRGARVDETLEFLRTCWTATGPVSFDGTFIQITDMHLNPAKGADAAPPVWIGGNGAPALRRTAAYGDAWHPHIRGTTPQVLTEGLARIEELAGGRKPTGAFTAAIHCPLVIADRVAGDPWDIGRIEGPLNYVADILEEYRGAGLAHVIFTYGGSARRRIGIMEQVAEALSLQSADRHA